MTGLVPAISIPLAKPSPHYRDRRVKPGDDDMKKRSRDPETADVAGEKSENNDSHRSRHARACRGHLDPRGNAGPIESGLPRQARQ
jgi:hypothetical protein